MRNAPLTRREFNTLAVAGAVAATLGRAARAQEKDVFTLGSQSYSFRKFGFEDSIAQLKQLGLTHMEFCGVHFPADASAEGFAKVKETIAATGITTPCYGVEGFGGDHAANRKKFEFARALGVGILTADVEHDAFDNVEALCEEFQIKIAIHNHGPGARYDKAADTLKAVEGRTPLIGACLDTGHCLRSKEHPHEVIAQLGARLISMHLKDWEIGGPEKIVGEGDMDLAKVANALKTLKFAGPIMLEYEESPENPVPDMTKGLANWRAACA